MTIEKVFMSNTGEEGIVAYIKKNNSKEEWKRRREKRRYD